MTAPLRPVVVAVVDSGVDPSQPDLQGALVPGADFADSSGSTVDQYGHGTMVAGVIAARGNNGQGVAGVCWVCQIMPIKVLDANGAGTAASVAEGIRWAADHGANVINLSFILSSPDADVEASIADAHARGVLVVAAAGNNGSGDATYPAAYPFVVSVAATDDADQLYPWSSRGSWVTLAAPGCSLTTAARRWVRQRSAAPRPRRRSSRASPRSATRPAQRPRPSSRRRWSGRPSRSQAPSGAGGSTRFSSCASSLRESWPAARRSRRTTKGPPERALRLVAVRSGRARYAIATRTVLTDGASFRFATRTTWFVFTLRSTMRL